MAGRRGRGGRGADRRVVPDVECLESLALLSVGVGTNGHIVGPFVAPALFATRVSHPAVRVDAHDELNQQLARFLGTGINEVESHVEARGASSRSLLAQKVLGNPFIHSFLSNEDTFLLLDSDALTNLIGSESIGTQSQDQTSVTLTLPGSSILSIGTDVSLVQVPPTPGVPGFLVQVPTSGIRTFSDGLVSVQIPLDAIPAGVPVPTTMNVPTGSLSDIYNATGPILADALRLGVPHNGPNAPPTVPGLRLISSPARVRAYPGIQRSLYQRMFRIAVDRNLFTLNAQQQAAVSAGYAQFLSDVQALNQGGAFQPATPPAAPPLPRGSLGGTLEVSVGAFRNLKGVASTITGLQIPDVGNAPGRIDVGYVFDRSGNYGLALTYRGALLGAPADVASNDQIGGDLAVTVSNAPSLTALSGLSQVEGVTVGAALSGSLTSGQNANGVQTFSSGAGYGTGFDFGTGVSYTLVIPLGKVNALIPSAPG